MPAGAGGPEAGGGEGAWPGGGPGGLAGAPGPSFGGRHCLKKEACLGVQHAMAHVSYHSTHKHLSCVYAWVYVPVGVRMYVCVYG